MRCGCLSLPTVSLWQYTVPVREDCDEPHKIIAALLGGFSLHRTTENKKRRSAPYGPRYRFTPDLLFSSSKVGYVPKVIKDVTPETDAEERKNPKHRAKNQTSARCAATENAFKTGAHVKLYEIDGTRMTWQWLGQFYQFAWYPSPRLQFSDTVFETYKQYVDMPRRLQSGSDWQMLVAHFTFAPILDFLNQIQAVFGLYILANRFNLHCHFSRLRTEKP